MKRPSLYIPLKAIEDHNSTLGTRLYKTTQRSIFTREQFFVRFGTIFVREHSLRVIRRQGKDDQKRFFYELRACARG